MAKVKWRDRYDSLFQYYGQVHGVPWLLLKNQAVKESSLDPEAENPVTHASGLMQFMGPASRDVGLKDPRDAEEAIEAAAKYDIWLFGNIQRYLVGWDAQPFFMWRVAICSYNCGWGYCREALRVMCQGSMPLIWSGFRKVLGEIEYQHPSWPKPRRPKVEECIPYAQDIVTHDALGDLSQEEGT